jgi:uncharacterized protein GlcG (DUF336 family)
MMRFPSAVLIIGAASFALAQAPAAGAGANASGTAAGAAGASAAPAVGGTNAPVPARAGANALRLSAGGPTPSPAAPAANSLGAAAGAANAPAPAARGPSLDLALEAARIAVETCKDLDQKIGVTVVDSAGVLKVFLATDGASTRGVASSTNKALTSLAFGAPTSELGEKIKTDSSLADKISANPNYNTHAGGLLLKVGSSVIGAIGVGGAKGSEKDESCATAGLQKIQARLK